MSGRRQLLAVGAMLAASLPLGRALAQPMPLVGPVGGRRLTGGGPLGSLSSGPPGVTLDLSFMSGTLPTAVTFTRASTATYVNSAGTVQTAAANVARFDYNPNTLVLNGLLNEESRINYAIQSGAMSVAPWAAVNATLTAGASVAPDGTTSATRVTEDTSATTSHYTGSNQGTTPVNAPVTGSMYVRDVSRRWGVLLLYDHTTPANNVIVYFDLQSGTVAAPVLAGAATAGSASITNAGNGWWRVSVTATLSATATTSSILRVALANSMSSSVYTGNGTSALDVWGAQVEAGAFPTSYIPTVGSTVTRSADSCTIASIPGRNATGETWNAEFLLLTAQEANARVVGSLTTTVAMISFQNASLKCGNYDNVAGAQSSNTLPIGTIGKAASTWATPNTGRICTNAGPVALVTTMTSGFAGATTVKLGGDSVPGDQMNGYIRRLRYWPRVLADAEMQAVTT